MAIPSIPSTFNVQTANQQNYLSWDIAAGATSYQVQRSIDGVNYAIIASPSATNYLDTAVTLGTQYFYQVASTNGSGTSPYTQPQSVVPVPSGEASLGSIRLQAQQRADRVNSQFVSLIEWNQMINMAMFELYDLLVTAYGEEYFAAPAIVFNTNGTDQFYDLPNGTNYNSAPPFYKLLGVDLGLNTNAQPNNGWVTVGKFNLIDRNAYYYPNTNSSQYGLFNMRYRLFGNKIEFIPTPSASQPMRLWYIPRMTMLLKDTDITSNGISGWLQYVIVRAAKYALNKEESDTSTLDAELLFLKSRIEASAMNRDAGQPDKISDTRGAIGWGGGMGGGDGRGWGAGW